MVSRVPGVGLAVVSMAARSPSGDDAGYLEWHLLDHLPEQYQLDGLRHGQRWASTPACRAVRAAESERFAAVDHVTQYLMADPPDQVVDDFLDLGARLRAAGRYPARLPSVMLAGFVPQVAAAAARVLVSDGVVPYRPNRGAYVILERPPDGDEGTRYRTWLEHEHLPELVGSAGVAGAWMLAPGRVRPDRLDADDLELTILYLDGDPAEVGAALAGRLRGRWDGWESTPVLAAPFETVRPWAWDRVLPA
jgi:hypothetical protein